MLQISSEHESVGKKVRTYKLDVDAGQNVRAAMLDY
jgi:hypothetical protein